MKGASRPAGRTKGELARHGPSQASTGSTWPRRSQRAKVCLAGVRSAGWTCWLSKMHRAAGRQEQEQQTEQEQPSRSGHERRGRRASADFASDASSWLTFRPTRVLPFRRRASFSSTDPRPALDQSSSRQGRRPRRGKEQPVPRRHQQVRSCCCTTSLPPHSSPPGGIRSHPHAPPSAGFGRTTTLLRPSSPPPL